MIGWPYLLYKLWMIPPCHLDFQKFHIHWKYNSIIYSHTVSHFPAASHRQQSDQLDARRCLPWRYHRVASITWSPLWRPLIHQKLKSVLHQNNTFSLRRRASLRTLPTTLIVRDWENNGAICNSTCAARCRLRYQLLSLVFPHLTTKINTCV